MSSSSSSSDSDSDDLEPIRRIKINIKPKEEIGKRDGADINEIKASVESWRPLGPRPHHSLSRRQSSMSSISSLSYGTGAGFGASNNATTVPTLANIQGSSTTRTSIMHSSPSCSNLVNEFNNRSSFTNFMSNTSRTSSPLTTMSNFGDTVPIAIAIQESIEMIVHGQKVPNLGHETKFDTRALGNIKVAFPNAFAQRCYSGLTSSIPILKLRMHSTENIIRYYASRLITDLDLSANGNSTNEVKHNASIDTDSSSNSNKDYKLLEEDRQKPDKFSDLFDLVESPTKGYSSSKIIEFDMDALFNQLKQLYEQSPGSRYYNVDVLRYQIAPIDEIDKCPLQVCAYWKSEPKLTKIRIDLKHSSKCGLNLERLRDIRFIVDLANFIPPGIDINSLSPESLSAMRLNNNNNNTNNHDNNTGAMNIAPFVHSPSSTSTPLIETGASPQFKIPQPPPPLNHHHHHHPLRGTAPTSNTTATPPPPPFVTYEPQAHWNNNTKQLTWKFDNLLAYYKSDGFGSLLAKLDFRNNQDELSLDRVDPKPVDVKFMVVDSTLSKVSLSIDTTGYRMSLCKKEIRSGRYRSEPNIF